MIISSDRLAYDGKKYTEPLWQLDTERYMVLHREENSDKVIRTVFHSECVRYHINYVAEKAPKRLKALVDSGEILKYLEDLETGVYKAIDEQIGLWRAEDTEYQLAIENNDTETQAKIENLFEMQAKEMIYITMVYV